MNLHAIVAPAIRAISPATAAILRRSTGYTIAPNGKQIPSYAPDVPIIIDLQELSAPLLAQMAALNIEGNLSSVWWDGILNGVNRASGTGGDLMIFNGATWLVVQVVEVWSNSGWSHVVVQQQK